MSYSFSFSCFNIWLAKLVKKITLNAMAAMPILYMKSMSEKKSAKMDTSISANTRTSCTLLRLPRPVLKLICNVTFYSISHGAFY